jgi:uncharacterized repeat protein (TIGR03803 family)
MVEPNTGDEVHRKSPSEESAMPSPHSNEIQIQRRIAGVGPKFVLMKSGLACCCLAVASLVAVVLAVAQPVHAQVEAVLYNFPGYSNGESPEATMIIDTKGNLYGTTTGGGVQGYGSVFEITLPKNKAPKERVRHSFPVNSNPVSSLVFDGNNNLYGTAKGGGPKNPNCPQGCGIAYEITSKGQYVVLHKFLGGDVDGANPYGGVAVDSFGNIYGTTVNNGVPLIDAGCGTIYEITPPSTEQILYTFSGGDGCYPTGGLIIDDNGILYGTTSGGGDGCGTVFQFDTNSDTFATIYDFFGGSRDGCIPVAGLSMDMFGFLYGTTSQGGGYGCADFNGCGTVFTVDPTSGNEQVLYSFTGGTDGANPLGTVVLDLALNIYGTTFSGGTSNEGTVFKVDTGGVETVMHSFGGYPDGVNPQGGLVFDYDGFLYGTTTGGGVSGRGTVFYVTFQ